MVALAPPFRQATPADAGALADFVDFASEGLALQVWSRIAGPGGDAWAVGRERARRETGSFSYRNALVVETERGIAAGLIGYPLPDQPAAIAPDTPAMFVPLQELENLAPGSWYVNVLAAYPEHRGKGLGTALLALADDIAAELHKPISASSSRTPMWARVGSTNAAATGKPLAVACAKTAGSMLAPTGFCC